MKKIISVILSLTLLCGMATACGKSDTDSGKTDSGTTDSGNVSTPAAFDTTSEITVVSREDGSGTRGAFIELTGVEQKNAEGKKEDKTTVEAIIANKTDVMLTGVAGDEYAIGYVSMGSLNSDVRAVKVDGIDATPANVKSGEYKLSRPFNIATGKSVSQAAQDFMDFIMSKQGQEVVAKSYITVDDNAKEYAPKGLKGKIVVAGSSSVSPLMEKLKEAYTAINPDVTIELQTSDSTAGMTAAMEGVCDIGMASRELKDSEKATLKATAIALDGIAVIVNNASTIDNLTKEQIAKIYTGETTSWDKI
ncbi:MAG: substrate-binding domain-containing protein [Oscillospiraceae bacterium]